MANLIDKTEIIKHRQISKSVRDDKIDPYITDAEQLDLKVWLGEQLYTDIVENPTEQRNVDLLDPKAYTYDGRKYSHQGLKKVLSILAFSRYVNFGSFTDTGFGYVQKSTQDSQPVTDANRRNIYKKDQDIAYKYWAEIRKFLDRNESSYDHWKADCTPTSKGFRISKITI